MSPEPALVSIVIPCFNQAHFLGEAIDGALAQTYGPVEVVVVDDGSVDNTSALARRNTGVRLVRQPNAGLARARNAGLAEAGGELVVFLDADDVLLPDAVATAVRAIEEHPEAAFVFGHSMFVMDDGSPAPAAFMPTFTDDHYRDVLAGCPILAPGSVTYRRSAVEDVGGFDADLSPAADYDMYYRLTRMHPSHCHGAVVVKYRRHGSSMTSNPRLMLRANVTALRRQRRHAIRRPDHLRAYRAGLRYWQGHLGHQVARQLQRDLWSGHPVAALRSLGALVRWSPRTLPALLRSPRRQLPAIEWRPSREAPVR